MPTNLVRVGSTYKCRSRIPQDLLRYYQPKKEVTESLHTKSLAEAKRLLPAIQLKYQQEWADMRAAIGKNISELPLNDVTIEYITACLEHESLSGDERTRLNGNYTLEKIQEYREHLADSTAELRDITAIGDIAVIQPAIEQYLKLKHIKVVGSEEAYITTESRKPILNLAMAMQHRTWIQGLWDAANSFNLPAKFSPIHSLDSG